MNDMEEGWIKISRSIVRHWLWLDAQRLQWWIDLIMMANWEDREWIDNTHRFTLRRGQLLISSVKLAKRWKRSRPTVAAFLNLLQEEGMIKREIHYRQIPVITICNYEKYQCRDDNPFDNRLDSPLDNPLYTSKEIKNIKKINNLSLTQKEPEEDFLRSFFSDENGPMLDELATSLYSSRACLEKLGRQIVNEWKLGGRVHSGYSDAASHMINLLRLRVAAQNKKQSHENKQDDRYWRRRGTEPSTKRREDYNGTF